MAVGLNTKQLKAAVITIITAPLIATIVVIYESKVGAFLLPAALAILIALIMLGAIIRRVRRNGFDPLEPIYAVFLSFLVGYIARSLYIAAGHYETMAAFDVETGNYYLVRALLVVLFGVAAFVIGYGSGWGEKYANKLPKFSEHIDPQRMKLITFVFTVVGLFSFYLLVQQSGGLGLTITDISRKRTASTEYIKNGAYLLFAAAVFRYILVLHGDKVRLLWLHLLVASMVPFVTSSRSNLILWWLIIAVLYHYGRKRLPLRFMATLVPVVLLVYSLMLGLRTSAYSSEVNLSDFLDIEQAIVTAIGGRDFADINTVAHIVRTIPERYPLQYERTFLIFITRPIPRALWPAKPVNFGAFVSQELYGRPASFGIIPPSLIGELYASFHLPGVVAGMFIFGISLRIAYTYLINNLSSLSVVTYYAAILFSTFKLVNFDINIGLSSILLFVIIFGLPLYWVSREKPPRTGYFAKLNLN